VLLTFLQQVALAVSCAAGRIDGRSGVHREEDSQNQAQHLHCLQISTFLPTFDTMVWFYFNRVVYIGVFNKNNLVWV